MRVSLIDEGRSYSDQILSDFEEGKIDSDTVPVYVKTLEILANTQSHSRSHTCRIRRAKLVSC
jgi:hypothetical protein